jgi:rhodanese-related sulfurtransferase
LEIALFDTVLRHLDFAHFASGSHKMSFSELFSFGNGVFLDVRAPEEHRALLLPLESIEVENVSIPIDQLPDRVAEIPRDRPIGVFCPTVVRSSVAYAYLRGMGYEHVRILDGGYPALAAEFLPGKLHGHSKRAASVVAE